MFSRLYQSCQASQNNGRTTHYVCILLTSRWKKQVDISFITFAPDLDFGRGQALDCFPLIDAIVIMDLLKVFLCEYGTRLFTKADLVRIL